MKTRCQNCRHKATISTNRNYVGIYFKNV